MVSSPAEAGKQVPHHCMSLTLLTLVKNSGKNSIPF